MENVPWAALLPLLVLSLAFVVYCLVDLARSEVKHFPKWAWAAICVLSVPLGGILYLTVGREPRVR
ncbi:PLD nuclease N-terminal domain-containing protein [Actinomycetota bacterium]